MDSAQYYIDISNRIAKKNNFFNFIAENFLLLAKIEESKGNTKKSYEYFKEYTNIKDSLFNAAKIDDINKIQRLYEVSKTNKQIEQFIVEQQVNERTIRYQKIIHIFSSISIIVLIVMFFQNRKLIKSYKIIVGTNTELLDSQSESTETHKKLNPSDKVQQEILKGILSVMDNVSIICNKEFTIDKLSELVHSKQPTVTYVIKKELNHNFRSLVNSYRIREAQRLLSEPNAKELYTIKSIADIVGFKSRNTFSEIFKDIVGVSPGFYIKEIDKKNNDSQKLPPTL